MHFHTLPDSVSLLFLCKRAEEAEGILDPQESDKLSFNDKCAWSPLLTQLWATSVLGSLSGQSCKIPALSACLPVCVGIAGCYWVTLGISASVMVASDVGSRLNSRAKAVGGAEQLDQILSMSRPFLFVCG